MSRIKSRLTVFFRGTVLGRRVRAGDRRRHTRRPCCVRRAADRCGGIRVCAQARRPAPLRAAGRRQTVKGDREPEKTPPRGGA